MSTKHLRLFTSHRLEVLADALAHRLADDPLDPLARETIVVPSRGMARWVNVHLARVHGVAASIEFPFPFTWARRVVEALGLSPASDPDQHDTDPFGAAALQWRLHEMLGQLDRLDAPAADLAPLHAYLEHDPQTRKRGQLAARLAQVFAGYQLQRPVELSKWERGHWIGEHPEVAKGEPWQAALWRSLVRDADTPPLARQLLRAIEGLREGSLPTSALGRRVEVFGVTTLAPVLLALLDALGSQIDVSLSFVSPTRGYWGDLRARPITLTPAGMHPLALELESADDEHEIRGHPLLASWGRLGRDFHRTVVGLDERGALEELEAADPPAGRLLGTLQRDILDFVDPSEREAGARPRFDAHDRSLRLHLCHSELREMEVVRDAILRAFEDLPDLVPSDVLVLVPDLARYAPFARAVLGRALEGSGDAGARRLPVRIADGRGLPAQAYGRLLLELMRLPDARLTATELLELFEIEAFARRFGLGSDDLPALRDLVRDAGVRWGVDPHQRAAHFELPVYEGASWQEGIDRLLLGFATGEGENLLDGLLPVADATTGRALLSARLARAFEIVARTLDDLRDARPLVHWARDLRRALLSTSVAEGEREVEERRSLITTLESLEEIGTRFGLRGDVGRRTVRDALRALLEDDAAGRGFVSGSVTVAELRPMRSLPYRVITVAGLGDEFPRRDPAPGFDLVAAHPRAGDRTARLDDRQLFLEILLSARERLVLTAVGRSVRDNTELARSVCVDELLEVLDRTFAPNGGRRASQAVVVRHPLQPFDGSYADRSDAELFTYDTSRVDAARAVATVRASLLAGESVGAPRFVDVEPAVAAPAEFLEVDLDDLARFYRDPSGWFVRNVLRMRLRRDEADLDTEEFALAGLDAWRLRNADLARATRALPSEDPRLVVQKLGLARGRLGVALVARQMEDVRAALEAASIDATAWREVEVAHTGENFELRGKLLVHPARGRIVVTAGALDARLRAQAWVEHVALGCMQPSGESWSTRLLALKDGALETGTGLAPETDATTVLAELVRGYRRAHDTPLAFYPETSAAWWKRWVNAALPLDGGRAADRIAIFLDEKVREAWDEPSAFGSGPESAREAVKLCVRGLDVAELASAEFAHWAKTVFGGIEGAST